MHKIVSHNQLNQLVEAISGKLQQLEGIVKEGQTTKIKIPRGVVRPIESFISEYGFVSEPILKRNICYAIEALDFYRWIINRFHLYGPVSGYIYKIGLILANMIIEGIVQDFLKQQGITPKKKHSGNIKKLEGLGVPLEICKKIVDLNERRANIHLHLVSDLEATKYSLRDWNKAILTLQGVKEYFKTDFTEF